MIDMTAVRMSQRDNIRVRNRRAREYSQMCRKRNKAKIEKRVDMMIYGFIIIISCYIGYVAVFY